MIEKTLEIKNYILNFLSNSLEANNINKSEISDNFDLLTEGIIDSLGMLELITAVEEHYGVNIDFEDLDAEEITIIGPISQYVASRISNKQS